MDGMNASAAGPWTIKGVPAAVVRRAVAADYGRTGTWIANAINAYIASGLEPRSKPTERSFAVKPWTVKGVPLAARKALTAAAKHSRMNVGEWLIAAIEYRLEICQRVSPTSAADNAKQIRNLFEMMKMCDELLRVATEIRAECKKNIAMCPPSAPMAQI